MVATLPSHPSRPDNGMRYSSLLNRTEACKLLHILTRCPYPARQPMAKSSPEAAVPL